MAQAQSVDARNSSDLQKQQTGDREEDETDGLPQPSPKADGIEVQFDVTVGMPSGRCVPSALGMYVRRTGGAL